jgi:hypothetical protein
MRSSVIRYAILLTLFPFYSAQVQADVPSDSCRDGNLVIAIGGWTTEKPAERVLFPILQGSLKDLQRPGADVGQLEFSRAPLFAPAPWYSPLSRSTEVGGIIAGPVAESRCLQSGGLNQEAQRLEQALRGASSAAGLGGVRVIPLRDSQIAREKPCSPRWFIYYLEAGASRDAAVENWVDCQRPRTTIGSYQSNSDGTHAQFMVVNPFEISGWCRDARDVEAERQRLVRECPGAARVTLMQNPMSSFRALDYFGHEFFLSSFQNR